MNCHSLRRILPELASGELNDSIRREALSHISTCPACTREYESFKKALDALSEPRQLVDVPNALNYLHLTEKQTSHQRKRLSLALAALLIAGLALGFIWQLQPKQKSVVQVKKNHPIEKRIVNNNAPKVQEHLKNIEQNLPIKHARLVSKEPLKPVNEKHRLNRKPQSQRIVAANPDTPLTARFQNKSPESDRSIFWQDRHTEPEDTADPESTVIVVAAWEEPQIPYNVDIEVKNPDSGMVSLHSASRDENGMEQEQLISVNANANTLNNGRTEL